MSAQNIVFFDGVCNLCNSWVNFLIKKEPSFKLAALQGQSAKKYLPNKMISQLDSVAYLKNQKVLTKSSAIIELLSDLGGPWRLVLVFKIIPKFIADPAYSLVAKSRYKFFGKQDSCRLPTENEKLYFID